MTGRPERVKPEERRVLSGAFPSSLASDVDAVLQLLPVPPTAKTQPGETVSLSKEKITLPYRFRYDPIERHHTETLTPRQSTLFDCLYSRHEVGHVREAGLRRILGATEPWAGPYVLYLLADYVIEISAMAAADEDFLRSDRCAAFANDNPDFMALLTARATSYWDCHYRDRFSDRRSYPPLVALRRLRQRAKSLADPDTE